MTEDIFKFPYKVLTYLGLWCTESKSQSVRFLYLIYQSWALFYLLVFVSFLFWDLFSVWKDVHKASTNLSATISTLMFLWKNTQGLKNLSRVQQLQRNLHKGLYTERDESDRRIVRRAVLEMKVTCGLVYFMGICTMTGWVISGLILTPRDAEENLPLPVWIPWDHRESPFYELALLYQIYGGYFVMFDALSLNLTIFGTIVQICNEYNILLKNTGKVNEWYEAIYGKKEVRAFTEEENKHVKEMIIRNIRHHQKIIHCTNEAENCYVHMMLIQFGGSALLITVVFLDLILVTRELNSRVYPLIIFLVLVTSDIYLFCNYGSRLISKGHDFLKQMYRIPWEVMSPKNQKIISIVILKAQRPPKLTVEKFANIDRYSLLKLTKIVYNVLYLLLHLAKER